MARKKQGRERVRVALFCGPEDGFEGWRDVLDLPGKLPLLAERHGKHKYVYQARQFLSDDRGDSPLPMDFVQIIAIQDDET